MVQYHVDQTKETLLFPFMATRWVGPYMNEPWYPMGQMTKRPDGIGMDGHCRMPSRSGDGHHTQSHGDIQGFQNDRVFQQYVHGIHQQL